MELVIVEGSTIEKDFGWVFFYNSAEYLRTLDFRYALGGNAPIIVDKKDGKITVTGTAHCVEHYIDEYEKSNHVS